MAPKKLSAEDLESIKDAVISETEAETEANPDHDADVEQVLQQVGETAKFIVIHRLQDRSPGKWDYLLRVEVSEFSLENIKEEFGGGNYRGKIYNRHGKYVKGFSFSIDTRFKPNPKIDVVEKTITENPSGLSEIRSLIENQNQVIRMMLEKQNASQTDPLQTALQMTQIFSGMNKPAQTEAINVNQMFDIFKEGMKVGQMSEGDSYGSVLETMGKPLIELLTKQSVQADKVLEKTNATVPKTLNSTPKPERPLVNNINDYIKTYLPQLLILAKKEKPASLYADLMLDQLPDKFFNDFAEFIQGENVFEKLMVLKGDVKNYENWFNEFIECLKNGIIFEDAPPVTEGSPVPTPLKTSPKEEIETISSNEV